MLSTVHICSFVHKISKRSHSLDARLEPVTLTFKLNNQLQKITRNEHECLLSIFPTFHNWTSKGVCAPSITKPPIRHVAVCQGHVLAVAGMFYISSSILSLYYVDMTQISDHFACNKQLVLNFWQIWFKYVLLVIRRVEVMYIDSSCAV